MVVTRRQLVIASSLLLLAILGPVQFLHQVTGGGGGGSSTTWSSPTAVEQVLGIDFLQDVVQASNGTLWLAWESDRFGGISGRTDVLYKTMTGVVWSPTYNFTNSGWNAAPSLAQLTNGTILLLWSSNATGNWDLYYKRYNGAQWSSTVQLTTTLSDDTLSSATVGRDGTLWLVWTRLSASCTITPCRQLYYKTLKNGVWSPDLQLTTDATWNWDGSVAVAKDGRVWVVWSKWMTNNIYQIFTKVYNGTTWGPDTQVVFSNNWELHPSIMQDRNGTLWIFWAREQSAPANQFQDDIFSKFSTNNGVTWSSDTQMTFDPSCCLIDDKMPVAVQGSDRSIWLFYTSDLTGGGADFDIYYMKSSAIYPVHDVTVSSVKASPSLLYPGGLKSIGQSALVQVSVTVSDLGDFPEAVQVSVWAVNTTKYFSGTAAGSVALGGSVVLSLLWNTTFVKPGWYGFLASVAPVPGETVGDSGDNTLLVKRLVHVIPLGDVNQDGKVDFFDVLIFAAAYGSSPGSSRWNPYCDINGNGTVDFLDLLVLAANYGTVT